MRAILQGIMLGSNISIRVFDLRNRDEGGYVLTVNLFKCDEDEENTSMVDLLAYRHHMRWLKMCDDALTTDRKSWKVDFAAHLKMYSMTGWSDKVAECWAQEKDGENEHRIITLNPCRFCKVCVKTPQAPEAFYGLGISDIAWNSTIYPVDEPYVCGMMKGNRIIHY